MEASLEDGRLTIRARNIPLGEVLEKIQALYPLRITGLEDRADETVVFFSEQEPPEQAIRRLLRHLGEDNYALEFKGARLSRVAVVPRAGPGSAPPPRATPAAPTRSGEPMASVVRVNRVLDDTQAQEVDLRRNDLIIEYDGRPITSPGQLVQAVKEIPETEQVDLLVVRDGEPIRYTLKGGFIGVQIAPHKIPRAEYDLLR